MDARSTSADSIVELGLNAAIVAVRENIPYILLLQSSQSAFMSLPFGPFTPVEHRTLEIGLRRWVKEQTHLELGYVEQLYTFGDRGRHARISDEQTHIVSVGYLALYQEGVSAKTKSAPSVHWQDWYKFLPWEDWRDGKPVILDRDIIPKLEEWSRQKDLKQEGHLLSRKQRVRICFGTGDMSWDEEKVLERYELLYAAGLVEESRIDGREAADIWGEDFEFFGRAMAYDHRRILATAIGRLRGKLKYRPVVFELMPEKFTLFQLQKVVECISGTLLHKQNFRRLVETTGLVDDTGEMSHATGGRPAKLFRFRPTALLERPSPGLRVKVR